MSASTADVIVCVFRCAPTEARLLVDRVIVVDETEELSKPHGAEALACAQLGLEVEARCRGVFFCGPRDASVRVRVLVLVLVLVMVLESNPFGLREFE